MILSEPPGNGIIAILKVLSAPINHQQPNRWVCPDLAPTIHPQADQGKETDDDHSLPDTHLPDAQPDFHSPGACRVGGPRLDNPPVCHAPVWWWAGRPCGPGGAGPDPLYLGRRGSRPDLDVGYRDAAPPAVLPHGFEDGRRDGSAFGERTGPKPDLPG